jgi:hypothetical protein
VRDKKNIDANASTGQCCHIIAGYAPTTAHTNAECEEYYDELDEHIAKKRPNDILIIAADCNANVGIKQSWAKDTPAKLCALGNHGNKRTNARGERFLDFRLEHSVVIAPTCFEKNVLQHLDLHPRQLQRIPTWPLLCATVRLATHRRLRAYAEHRSATPTTWESSWLFKQVN